MDFDLNETPHHQFLEGLDSTFENDFFQWNMNYEQPDQHEERGSPNQANTSVANADANLDERCISDGLVESLLHNDDEVLVSTDDEELAAEDGNVHGSLTLCIEKRLCPGSKLESLDQAYLLYCEYARLVGFSVKRGSQKYYNKLEEVRVKEYLCSCHGKSNSKQMTERLHYYKKQDYRCNCKAKLIVVRGLDGKCTVSKFNKDHNHELADPDHSYLLRSSRNMSHAKKSLLEALQSAGIRVKDACRFMEKESGGPANTGFIRKDAYHHMDQVRRKSKLEDADSDSLIQHFIEKSNREHGFYWNMQKDDEGRLLNFFFRDSRSAVDYELFSDVLSFDTTYKTNKYGLICAPFVGVNHHMKNCLFGMAFLSDETTSTFEWLFSNFLESMDGKEPGVVFTDQCQAMMNAIDLHFKSSSHRLCQWHINQNAPSHFGSLNCNNEFKSMWFHCMNGCESIDEFETTWSRMIDDYELVDARWFRNMYNLRRRWSSAFTKDKFCAGLHATSRSEVTNKVLKDISSSSGSLYDFVMKYEQIQLDWRRMEGEDDTVGLGVPGLLVKKNPLLKQAAEFFTRSIYMSYEYEATYSLNVDILSTNNKDESNELEFVVTCSENPSRIRRVTYNTVTSEASCSCCLWQSVGVLCAHIFRIYFHHNIKVIPPIYLMHRLSRDAKRRRAVDVLIGGESSSKEDNLGEDRAFNSHIMRSTYDLLHAITMDSKMKAHYLNRHNSLRDELLSMAEKGNNQPRREVADNMKNAAEKPTCRDPVIPPNRRFTNTRCSRHWEKSRRKGKKRAAPEIASRINTRIPRMQRASSSRFEDTIRVTTPATSNTDGPMGHDFMSYSQRDFTSPTEPLNFFATQ